MKENTLKTYLDTCVVSGLARNDLESNECQAILELLRRYESGYIEFVTSEVTLTELEAIPPHYQTPHLAIYHLLRKIRTFPEPSFTRLGASGTPMANPLRGVWSKIRAILPDENDAKHVFQAVEHNIDYFLTVDNSTILKYKSDLSAQTGVNTVKPSELLALMDA